MPKTAAVIRNIETAARKAGLTWEHLREGGNHTIYSLDGGAPRRVAWSDRRVGMGIQFETVDPANQTIIDTFVDAHFFSNRKA